MKILAAAALALCTSAPAFAADTLIDFETVTSFASIANFYNGGTDSAGHGGSNLGVSFGGDALGLVNDVLGPYFSNAPSAIGVMAPVGADATMNVAAGFTNAISFFYSSSSFLPGAVSVYSGLDGTGQLLASFNLVANAQAGGCSDSPFCRFDQLSSTFVGTAHSVTFGNAAGFAGFDDIRISAVPEPTSALLMALGVAALRLSRRPR
jgi:hypothetical protein